MAGRDVMNARHSLRTSGDPGAGVHLAAAWSSPGAIAEKPGRCPAPAGANGRHIGPGRGRPDTTTHEWMGEGEGMGLDLG